MDSSKDTTSFDGQMTESSGQNTFSLPREQFIARLVDLDKKGWVPTLGQAKELVERFQKEYRKNIFDSQQPQVFRDSQGNEKKVVLLPGNPQDQFFFAETLPLVRGDKLYTLLKIFFSKLDQQTAANLGIYIIGKLQNQTQPDLADETTQLFTLAFEGVNVTSPETFLFGEKLLEFAQTHIDEKAVPNSPRFGGYATNDSWYLHHLLHHDRQIPLYRVLAYRDQQEANETLGIFLRSSTLPAELNVLRRTLSQVNEEEKPKIEHLIRSILNLLTGLPVHTSLENLYAKIKFEEYRLSLLLERQRISEIITLLTQLGVNKNDSILDLGSGTGWLVGGLYQEGFEHVKGLEISDRNIQVARERYGNFFIKGDWKNIPFSLKDQKVIIAKERTLPHVEDEAGFYTVLTQVAARLAPDGFFIFDMPNPTKGTYKENLDRYRAAMKKFGYSDQELKDFWYVVDSPDGQNFYNRFIPSREKIEEMLNTVGFEIIEERQEEMPDENENMLFVCKKRPR